MDITTYILSKRYADQAIKEAQLGSDVNLEEYYAKAELIALSEEEILEICKNQERN